MKAFFISTLASIVQVEKCPDQPDLPYCQVCTGFHRFVGGIMFCHIVSAN